MPEKFIDKPCEGSQPSQGYDAYETGGLPLLNIAAFCPATEAHGPGLRAAVWVQGCSLRCPGCLAPEWREMRVAELIAPEELARRILTQREIVGVTFSGGEPMLQAAGLAESIRLLRQRRDLSLICFTGFTIEQLRVEPPGVGVAELLAEVDALIDSPYIEALNDDRGLRGSSNQRIHFLTDRIRPEEYPFETGQRKVEIYIEDGEALFVGIPPHGVLESFEQALQQRRIER